MIAEGGKVAVLGAGVIGLSSSIELAKAGYEVTLIDQSFSEDSASFNNAGQLCYSNIEPIMDGKMLRDLPFLLMRSDGPLFLSRKILKEEAGWFKSAVVSCTPSNVDNTMIALATLNRIGWDSLRNLCTDAGIQDKLRQSGIVYGSTSKVGWGKANDQWQKKSDFGVKWKLVGPVELPQMLEVLKRCIHQAVYATEDGFVTSPREIVTGLATYAKSLGVTFDNNQVSSVAVDNPEQVVVNLEGGMAQDYNGCVVAMGIWSRKIAEGLGDKVQLISQRGYNITYPRSNIEQSYPAVLEDLGLAVTPLSEGIRVGGWIELDSVDAPPSDKIFKKLAKKAKEILPGLSEEGMVKWMGHRPSTPNSLPVIGPSTKAKNVLYAFGHGHLGLTQAAATASCVAALASGSNPPAPLAAFGIERFK